MADSMINGVNKINTVNYTISLAEVLQHIYQIYLEEMKKW